MPTICVIGDNHGWVIDDIVNDFCKYTSLKIVKLNENPDIIWFVSMFDYFANFSRYFSRSKIIVSVHHISEDKLYEYKFSSLSGATACIVPNSVTEQSLKKYVNTNIFRLPYWLLSKFLIESDFEIIKRTRLEFCNNGQILIGSFLKDGEGKYGLLPKLSKGPDVFLKILEGLKDIIEIKVVLTGHARQFVIDNLKRMNIQYVYMKKFNNMNLAYDILDWYFVTSRFEGGPQSILEAPYRRVKILSTNVGMATDVLHPDCICKNKNDFVERFLNNVDRTDYNYNSIVNNYLPSVLIPKYDDFFVKISGD